MKAWQKIVGLVLVTALVLGFYLGYTLYKIAKKIAEGFQNTGATEVEIPLANTDTYNPGKETQAEKETFDLFEYLNQVIFEQLPTTPVEAYDPASALAEFDESAPTPWDFDNKTENPKEILWGTVDSRCSKELWTFARQRALFNTANNVEIDPRNGRLSYYSNYLNTIFHDPKQIAAVKYAEFVLDFATEEIIEGTFERIQKSIFSESMEAAIKANWNAKEAVRSAQSTAKLAGRTLADTEIKNIFDDTYKTVYKGVLDQLDEANGRQFGASVGRFMGKSMILSRASKAVMDAGFRTVGKGFRLVGNLAKGVINSVRIKSIPAPNGVADMAIKAVGGTQLKSFGEKAAGRALAKMAGKRAAQLIRAVFGMQGGAAAVSAIPIIGQIISIAMFILSFLLLAIVPQVLSILADLDEDPASSGCQSSTQGCDDQHPYNIICALEELMTPAGAQIVQAIPLIGDGIAAFGPYLCSSTDGSSISFRQSFRAPPYYFDSTLSLYYTDKPKILDGGYNGNAGKDPMYDEPGNFKLRLTPPEYRAKYGVDEDTYKLGFKSNNVGRGQPASEFYHPWVDYAHSEMLDKMAAFYYDMAKRNQETDIDGIASFRYISKFMGIIASSQLSCDVQVKLREVRYDPLTNEKFAEKDVPDPGPLEQRDVGCSFHDRRFYFSVDYTKCSAYALFQAGSQTEDLNTFTLRYLAGIQPETRMAEYRRIFVVVGCTNANGTAPAVIDLGFGNNEFVGEAPVSLGPATPRAYLPPKNKITGQPASTFSATQSLPDETECNAVSSVVTSFSITRVDRDPAERPTTTPSASTAISANLELCSASEFGPTEITEETPTRARTFFDLQNKRTETLSLPRCNTQDDIVRLVTSPQQGDLGYALTEKRTYIYWSGAWIPHRPYPIWSRKTDPDNQAYLTNSAKFWRFTRIRPSFQQKFFQGTWGAINGALPLFFGLEGGLVATTLDVAGANAKLACAYSDVQKQQGTFAVNGFIVTSETHFVLNKGPLIAFAPGYTPNFANRRCETIPITQKVCANRYMIRSLAKKYQTENPGRRLKTITSIVPNMPQRECIYFTNTIGLNTDNTDNDSTLTSEIIKAAPTIQDRDICAFGWSTEQKLTIGGTTASIPPLPFETSMFSPPLTEAEFNSLPNRASGFLRRGCTVTSAAQLYGDCSKDVIKNALIADFNNDYMVVEGNPSLGFYARITDITAVKTPPPNDPSINSLDPVCVYKANVERTASNGTTTRTSHIIKMILEEPPTSEDKCLYQIKTHDFPRKMFLTPVPRSGVLELPGLGFKQNTANFLRPGCTLKEFTDTPNCSNPTLMKYLLNQFNKRIPDTKILQVVRSGTPIVEGDAGVYCDYEADVFGTVGSKPYMERQSLRFRLKPATGSSGTAVDPEALKCLYDIDFDYTNFKTRGSGRSILKNSADQLLKTPYYWPISYTSYIRDNITAVLARVFQQDIPTALKDASSDMKSKLNNLQNALRSGQEIVGCVTRNPDTTKLFSCRNPLFVRAFIRRYNFDNWPTYPSGQFGSTRRSIIGLRRAGLAGGTECHIELIEREEYNVNYLKEPIVVETANLGQIADTATLQGESNKKSFLRQYSFNVVNPSLAGTAPNQTCSFTMSPFTPEAIKNRTFDISGEAYGINVEEKDAESIKFTQAQLTELSPDLRGTPAINPWSVLMLNRIRAAVAAYKPSTYGKPNFLSMELERLYVAVNVAPNIIEYGATVKETYSDPDFGFAVYRGEKVIIIARWDEPVWNPVAGEFAGGAQQVPAPTAFSVMNILRAAPAEGGARLRSDGFIFEYPPYLYFTTTTLSANFLIDYNPKTERTRLVYPAGSSSYVFPNTTGGWNLASDSSAKPTIYADPTPVRLYTAL